MRCRTTCRSPTVWFCCSLWLLLPLLRLDAAKSLTRCIADSQSWAHLPVALWNDEYYDSKALYTGSATLVGGTDPVIVYPGISDPPTGGTFNVARPTNRSDPLLVRWTKAPHNPMMTGTSDDPSSAWLTDYGEWRFVGQSVPTADGAGLPLYSAGSNFSSLELIGVLDQDLGGDCMSMFPLPPLPRLSTAGPAPPLTLQRGPRPTHVLMQSSEYRRGGW